MSIPLAALRSSLFVSCALGYLLTLGTPILSAQSPNTRALHVTVTDPLNRFVTGLAKEHFEVTENGVRRNLAEFSDPDASISLAVVSEVALPNLRGLIEPNDELIQTQSIADAVRQLAASKKTRKALIISNAGNFDAAQIPGGIQALQTDPSIIAKTIVELRNQYLLVFESSNPSAATEVIVNQPRGLPALKVNRK